MSGFQAEAQPLTQISIRLYKAKLKFIQLLTASQVKQLAQLIRETGFNALLHYATA
jgi:hypothetical protein